MATDTLMSTFSTFFGDDDKPEHKCTDCDSEENLEVLFTSENGDQTWVCSKCKAQRDVRQASQTSKARARVQEWAWRDRWEE